ncbi:16240_t:CDS:2 [Dentiscutata heterogama]|uniref:16240_t:CDS:1 n=1 Tax=Dentiscutata heterogama TaxID=1316150 RepID=A0ACA9LK76_9GLOM|nr:16240_t:CDS:2 [Dentiscutata heterogama]
MATSTTLEVPRSSRSLSRCPSPSPGSRCPSPSQRSRCSSPAPKSYYLRSQSPMPQISRDENDAIRRVVDELIENFVDMKERGNQDETISRFINDFIIDNKRFPSQIYDWLLNNQNTPQYITLLGYFYFDSIGIEEDLRKSFSLFLTASKMDYSIAQDLLADCYNYGFGTSKNEELSFMWYQKAIESGSVNAENGLGACYRTGFGIKKDKSKTALHYKNAAKKGNCTAMFYLAWCYEKAFGVAKDYDQAISWYEKADKNGNLLAFYSLDKLQRRMNKSASQPPSEPSTSSPQSDSQEETDSVSSQEEINTHSSQKGEEEQKVEAVKLIITNEEQFDESTLNENEK